MVMINWYYVISFVALLLSFVRIETSSTVETVEDEKTLRQEITTTRRTVIRWFNFVLSRRENTTTEVKYRH